MVQGLCCKERKGEKKKETERHGERTAVQALLARSVARDPTCLVGGLLLRGTRLAVKSQAQGRRLQERLCLKALRKKEKERRRER